ncbi:MAG: hypothetical protein JSU59_04610, partial [Nitrospirota bacterium]
FVAAASYAALCQEIITIICNSGKKILIFATSAIPSGIRRALFGVRGRSSMRCCDYKQKFQS